MVPSFLLSSLALVALVAASQQCKCLPGDSCFPDSATWAEFSKTLSSPVISGIRPLASVCYSDDATYNASACMMANASQYDALYRGANVNTLQYPNFEELITSNGTVEGCPFPVSSTDVCYQGRVPSYAVNVSTVQDIQSTLQFATKYNLHLVVKNTGHELMGRAFGVGSLELHTYFLNSTNFTDNFVPTGAPDDTPGQYAVTVGAGVQWGILYAEADQRGRVLGGGFSPGGTVGAAAGYVLGGGHSVLAPFYGLAVDNVLQFTAVIPNGSYVTVNQYSHPDLFWALRGGGGPSFGIVTSTTYKTHPSVPITTAFYTATANSSTAYNDLLETWFQFHNEVSDAGWSGVWPFVEDSLYLTFFAQGTPPYSPTANSTMESFFAASRAIPGVNVTLAISVPYPSFEAFNIDNLMDSSKGYGFNFSSATSGVDISTSSWILPRNVTAPNMADTLANICLNITIGVGYMVAGGAVSQFGPDSASVTPAWRTAISDVIAMPAVDPTNPLGAAQMATQQIQPLRELAPVSAGGGQYLNEPEILLQEWQSAYWGPHYPRLLSLKKALDPFDLLIVPKGVNSEQWDDEIVCKTV
ncbi:hypothetical protein HYDPIDRAFT_111875 [Hydnomerulius pinastri MD-312]|uniref:FAD-binding PCMH-type domain-containing protein n=1 Tax=Hydnomerulius pinastri MD-312 TaxID=994086 RepID=A0A0C9W130_9AGAM|nr:hypothetical protein HYDPIDRAFT_111875 [Hydnomerulius pinastri MD-312]